MNDMRFVPLDRHVFCRLKSTGKLVIAKYKRDKHMFEVVRDEIYFYEKNEFDGWKDVFPQPEF